MQHRQLLSQQAPEANVGAESLFHGSVARSFRCGCVLAHRMQDHWCHQLPASILERNSASMSGWGILTICPSSFAVWIFHVISDRLLLPSYPPMHISSQCRLHIAQGRSQKASATAFHNSGDTRQC